MIRKLADDLMEANPRHAKEELHELGGVCRIQGGSRVGDHYDLLIKC